MRIWYISGRKRLEFRAHGHGRSGNKCTCDTPPPPRAPSSFPLTGAFCLQSALERNEKRREKRDGGQVRHSPAFRNPLICFHYYLIQREGDLLIWNMMFPVHSECEIGIGNSTVMLPKSFNRALILKRLQKKSPHGCSALFSLTYK